MRFRLQAPTNPGDSPANVSLRVPDGGPWPPFSLTRNRWTTLAVDDLDDLGRGSLGLDLLVDPVDAVRIDARVDFAGERALAPTSRARGTTTFAVQR